MLWSLNCTSLLISRSHLEYKSALWRWPLWAATHFGPTPVIYVPLIAAKSQFILLRRTWSINVELMQTCRLNPDMYLPHKCARVDHQGWSCSAHVQLTGPITLVKCFSFFPMSRISHQYTSLHAAQQCWVQQPLRGRFIFIKRCTFKTSKNSPFRSALTGS